MARAEQPPAKWPGLRQTIPHQGRCTTCGQQIRIGYFEGWITHYDIHALTTIHQECQALLTGHRTFHVVGDNIYRRSAQNIQDNPQPHYGHIYRNHICDGTNRNATQEKLW